MSENATDLNILDPDQQITINNELVTVHEYRFLEGMRIQSLAQGLLEDLTTLFLDEPDRAEDLTVLEGIFADHAHVMPDLLAKSVGKDREWVESLSDADGQHLMMVWWSVNCQFFVRRLVAAAATRLGRAKGAALTGDTLPPN